MWDIFILRNLFYIIIFGMVNSNFNSLLEEIETLLQSWLSFERWEVDTTYVTPLMTSRRFTFK